jgi:hypothetical protein
LNLKYFLATFFFGAALFFMSPVFAHAQTGCVNGYNSAVAVPAGFGAAYNLFSTAQEQVINGCTTVFFGSGLAIQYIYKLGYVYTSGGWQAMNLTSTEALVNDAWYPKRASGEMSIPSVNTVHYVVGYICTWTGSVWKCGCADVACVTPMWQLQSANNMDNSGA